MLCKYIRYCNDIIDDVVSINFPFISRASFNFMSLSILALLSLPPHRYHRRHASIASIVRLLQHTPARRLWVEVKAQLMPLISIKHELNYSGTFERCQKWRRDEKLHGNLSEFYEN